MILSPLHLVATTLLLFVLLSPCVSAQEYEQIDRTTVSDPAGFTYAFPSDWNQVDDVRFVTTIWASDDSAYCTLKRTEDWSFDVLTAELYVAQLIENKQDTVALLPLQYPDGSGKLLMMKEFPFGLEVGIVIMTIGNMAEQSVFNATFQTINSGAALTLSCFTTSESQGYYFPIFTQIVDSFRFLES